MRLISITKDRGNRFVKCLRDHPRNVINITCSRSLTWEKNKDVFSFESCEVIPKFIPSPLSYYWSFNSRLLKEIVEIFFDGKILWKSEEFSRVTNVFLRTCNAAIFEKCCLHRCINCGNYPFILVYVTRIFLQLAGITGRPLVRRTMVIMKRNYGRKLSLIYRSYFFFFSFGQTWSRKIVTRHVTRSLFLWKFLIEIRSNKQTVFFL